MMLIKRITSVFLVMVIAGTFLMRCEKMDGPDPVPCTHKYNEMFFVSSTSHAPMTPAFQLDSLKKFVITDSLVIYSGLANLAPVDDTFRLNAVGKIMFQTNSNLP